LSAFNPEPVLTNRTKTYFASDFHLGVPTPEKSLIREKEVVAWLRHVSQDAKAIYLLGDIFDFWFEYKTVVAKGFVRLMGCIAELVDQGIEIHFFTGNHDMWTFGYLEKELGVKVHRKPITEEINGRVFFIGHGDGLGPDDKGYKLMKRVFSARFFQWLYARFHPNFSFGLAQYLSAKSRKANSYRKDVFLGEDKEFLILFIKDYLKNNHADFFVFGHRHITLKMPVNGSIYVNVGEWVNTRSYAVFDGTDLVIEHWGKE
jgi:UDP-2,3-diacylglucosamine hydrolase